MKIAGKCHLNFAEGIKKPPRLKQIKPDGQIPDGLLFANITVQPKRQSHWQSAKGSAV
jgi:hypothetical protein